VAGLATQFDEGALLTSGADIIKTLGVILSDIAEHDEPQAYNHCDVSKKDGDRALEAIALGAVLGILELGVLDRSAEDEDALKSLLPTLAALSSPLRQVSSSSEVAAQCCALIIYRGAKVRKATEEVVMKVRNSEGNGTEATLAEAATNLASPMPALRAFGVVQLSKLCKQYTLDRDHFTRVRDATLPARLTWPPIADIVLKALADNESYVYLAAAHALAAVADANPRDVLPWLQRSLEMSHDDTIKLRLGEALMVAIRRRGEAAPAYVAVLSRSLCYGASHDQSIATRAASFSLLGELCGVAGHTAHTFALDLCDLVASTLTMTQENPTVQRAASYLGYRALAGCGQTLLIAAPQNCAMMCRRLRIYALTSTDEPTRSHANNALHALDTLLADIFCGNTPGQGAGA
jgi:hypothetical protein